MTFLKSEQWTKEMWKITNFLKLLCTNSILEWHFFIIFLENCVWFPLGATSSWWGRKRVISSRVSAVNGAPPLRGTLGSGSNSAWVTIYFFIILFLNNELLGLQLGRSIDQESLISCEAFLLRLLIFNFKSNFNTIFCTENRISNSWTMW